MTFSLFQEWHESFPLFFHSRKRQKLLVVLQFQKFVFNLHDLASDNGKKVLFLIMPQNFIKLTHYYMCSKIHCSYCQQSFVHLSVLLSHEVTQGMAIAGRHVMPSQLLNLHRKTLEFSEDVLETMPENRVILKCLFSAIFHFCKLLEALISFLQISYLQLHPGFMLYSITMTFNQVLASPVVFKDTHKCLLFTRKVKPFS